MEKVSRTIAVQAILNSGGKMFTVSWKTKKGEAKRFNGKFVRPADKRSNQDKIFGLITVYDHRKDRHRRVDTRTISELRINGRKLRVC